jgi:hypothetical protein
MFIKSMRAASTVEVFYELSGEMDPNRVPIIRKQLQDLKKMVPVQ